MPPPIPAFGTLAWRVFLHVACCAAVSTSACAADFVYTVQPGDHPWNIAQRYLHRPALAQDLFRLNRIVDDRRIRPGTRLRIPETWLRLQTDRVQLVAADGEVRVQAADGGARAAVVGEWLLASARLLTGATGSARLEFGDGSRVLLLRDSELLLREVALRALGSSRQISLQLLRGGMENAVQPQASLPSRFEILTPAATAAVRGTQFRVHVRTALAAGAVGATSARTEVLEGSVAIANAAGQVLAAAGQGSVAAADQAPAAPVPLLPPPDLSALPARIERLPIDLPLPPLDGAVAYRTQLSPGDRFLVAASDENSTAPRVRARDVDDGAYVLRVRGIDAQGLEGRSAEQLLVVHARPEPPLLIEPAADAAVAQERPLLRWTQQGDELQYRVQLRAGDGRMVADQVVRGGSLQAEALAPGPYTWRVAAQHPRIGQGPWSDVQQFRRVPAAPGAVDTEAPQAGALTLRWPAQPGAARYQLQLARAASFEPLLQDTTTAVAQHPLQGLQPGTYHVRVRSLAADGYAGPWGSAQTFTVPEPEAPARDWRPWLLLPLLLLVF